MDNNLIKCPLCKKQTMKINQSVIETPYFGPLHIIMMRCKTCGVKFSDFYIIEAQPPRRFIFRVENLKQLNTRVIKSDKGRIKIPEFNFVMDPGPLSKAFITNVEGVLHHVKSTLETLKKWDKGNITKIEEIEQKLQGAFKGKFGFTLIIEDPTGKSGIIPLSDQDEIKIEFLKSDNFNIHH
ncbi:MAG: ZPR1 zinc finger domain-containing protein [Candidatus Ranarchaeia archaeon]